jgi:hypothetical protein
MMMGYQGIGSDYYRQNVSGKRERRAGGSDLGQERPPIPYADQLIFH